MEKQYLIQMAREAGWEYADDDRGFEPLWHFAELVAARAKAEEREACAQVAESVPHYMAHDNEYIAHAIRNRGDI